MKCSEKKIILKKDEGVPILNFEGGLKVPLLNLRSWFHLLNFEGVPGTGSRGPGPTFSSFLLMLQKSSKNFLWDI